MPACISVAVTSAAVQPILFFRKYSILRDPVVIGETKLEYPKSYHERAPPTRANPEILGGTRGASRLSCESATRRIGTAGGGVGTQGRPTMGQRIGCCFGIPNCRMNAAVSLALGIPYSLDTVLRGIIGGRMSCPMVARLHSTFADSGKVRRVLREPP